MARSRSIVMAMVLLSTVLIWNVTQAQAEKASVGVGVANPSVGMGLNGIVDWTSQQPFIDVMKTARGWTGHLPDQWGGWGPDDFAARGLLDEDGWLTAVPHEITHASTLILTDLPEEAVSANGRYRMTFKGQGTIRVGGRAHNLKRDGDSIWFDFLAGPGFVEISITRTDPDQKGDHIRDIQVVKEANIRLHEVGTIFNPLWVQRIEDQRLLRFMDWMSTNDSPASTWDQRPKVSDFTYTRHGAPVEIMVALANQTGADPWFNMPHMATDDYMRRFAEYVRDNLDPALKAHIEFSNEVWNWQFSQAQWAEAEGKKRWGQDSKWVEFYGLRAAQMAQIWDEAFADQASTRLVKVISTQTGWLGLEEAILGTPLWVAEDAANNRPSASYFDAYAITGYFDGGLGGDAKADIVKGWISESRAAARAEAQRQGLTANAQSAYVETHQYDIAVDLAVRELRDGSVTGNREGTIDNLIGTIFRYHRNVAARHGLDLVMYEGGSHVTASGAWVEDPELTPFFIHLNYSAQMGDLYRSLLDGWKSAGGTLFNAFVDVSAPSKWGSWGALRHLTDNNSRADALAAFNSQTPAWWETREPETFLHGVTVIAPAAGRIKGTAKADILIGSDKDDIFESSGGSDRIHGSRGNDHVILPGLASDYKFRREGEALTATHAGMEVVLVSIETLSFTEIPDQHIEAAKLP